MRHTLELYHGEDLLFCSDGKWLYPLFELEKYLEKPGLEKGDLLVKDKIIGRAAALILVHLGIRNVRAGVLSKPGKDVLLNHDVTYSFEKLVERILCRTEKMLQNEINPEAGYKTINDLIHQNENK